MQRLMIMLTVLMTIFIFSSNSFAQNKAKPKVKTKITKPVPNPTSVGEKEKNLSKTKNVQNKTEASVFEPNNANTWIETHEFQPAITGKGKSKANTVSQGGAVKKPIVFEDVIISSKTSKPKRKPTKSTTSKRKPQ
jgi:hypothetical protein